MADHALQNEQLISLSQAASRYPGRRGAKRLHPATLTRWILKGVRAANGQLIRLEATRLGAAWMTSAEALERFQADLTAASLPADAPTTPTRTPVQRKRASDAAAEELRRLGA